MYKFIQGSTLAGKGQKRYINYFYLNCTFKDVKINNSIFVNCIFRSCTFQNVHLTDCSFRRTLFGFNTYTESQFRYCTFDACTDIQGLPFKFVSANFDGIEVLLADTKIRIGDVWLETASLLSSPCSSHIKLRSSTLASIREFIYANI